MNQSIEIEKEQIDNTQYKITFETLLYCSDESGDGPGKNANIARRNKVHVDW